MEGPEDHSDHTPRFRNHLGRGVNGRGRQFQAWWHRTPAPQPLPGRGTRAEGSWPLCPVIPELSGHLSAALISLTIIFTQFLLYWLALGMDEAALLSLSGYQLVGQVLLDQWATSGRTAWFRRSIIWPSFSLKPGRTLGPHSGPWGRRF